MCICHPAGLSSQFECLKKQNKAVLIARYSGGRFVNCDSPQPGVEEEMAFLTQFKNPCQSSFTEKTNHFLYRHLNTNTSKQTLKKHIKHRITTKTHLKEKDKRKIKKTPPLQSVTLFFLTIFLDFYKICFVITPKTGPNTHIFLKQKNNQKPTKTKETQNQTPIPQTLLLQNQNPHPHVTTHIAPMRPAGSNSAETDKQMQPVESCFGIRAA